MSPTPSIPLSPPADKDPPSTAFSPSTTPNPPSIHLRNPPKGSKSMRPPSRPTISTRTSFEPQHILHPQLLEESSAKPEPRTLFTPFFTLVNDTSTHSMHHPTKIHYIFSDDDSSELLTASLLKSLEGQDSRVSSPAASRESLSQSSEGRQRGSGTTSSSSSATFRKEKENRKEKKGKGIERKKDVKRDERVIIVDINESGDGISAVSSLSAGWQVLNASIDSAPTFDGAADSAEARSRDKGLMLRIEGVSTITGEESEGGREGLGITGKGKVEGSGVMGDEEMQALLEGFDKKMGILRRIVGAGEEYAAARERDKGEAPAEV